MNIGEPWPDLYEAEAWVHRMQTKLHQWAVSDPDRRFDDLYNLVYDPAFLVVAFSRVRDNKALRGFPWAPGPERATELRPSGRTTAKGASQPTRSIAPSRCQGWPKATRRAWP